MSYSLSVRVFVSVESALWMIYFDPLKVKDCFSFSGVSGLLPLGFCMNISTLQLMATEIAGDPGDAETRCLHMYLDKCKLELCNW